ncbi:MAG TPA: flagellar motor protein MotB, partial [Terracidiphilus sp.]|nr:flagellar motor protein MotB [Terracidiphilus sp.]
MRARVHRSRVTHDRWLVSYADFITLLFSFFVVLYAFARADKKQQAQIPQSIDSAFKSLGVFSGSSQASASAQGAGHEAPALPINIVMGESVQSPAEVRNDLNRIRRDLTQRLSDQVAQHTVAIKMGRDGLVISLREAGFFKSGSAIAQPQALPALRQIAASLAGTPYNLRVEGHTDNIPIHTPQFDSNWELSSARASGIGRLLLNLNAIPPDRLSAAGYAEFHPADTNETPAGRANNRRVDLVVLPRSSIDLSASA